MLISAIHRFSTILWKQLSAFLLFFFFCISVSFCIVLYLISNYVFHTHLHFCTLMLALGPELFFFPYSLVWGRHGLTSPGPVSHLWEVAYSVLLLYWLQSTKTPPFRTLLHWVSACLMPSVRKREYNAMVMYNNGYYRKYKFSALALIFYIELKNSLDFCHTDAFLYLSL